MRWHGGFSKDAVDAVSNAEVGFHRFDVDVGCAVFVGFPDDLVYEFYDGGFLIEITEVLFEEVVFIVEVELIVFHHLVEGFGADAVEFA